MKVDLHVHIHATSRCAKQSHIDAAITAKKHGLDAIAILDHHYYPTDLQRIEAEAASGVRVFLANEICVRMNGGKNDIVLVSEKKPDFDTGEYHKRAIGEAGMDQIMQFCKETTAFWFLAHPFRRGKPIFIDLGRYTPDAIELASRNTPVVKRQDIIKTADQYNIPCIATSDAHKTRQLGGFCIELDEYAGTNGLLKKAIKEKRFSLLEKRLAQVIERPRNPTF
jgi:hypothetical protein